MLGQVVTRHPRLKVLLWVSDGYDGCIRGVSKIGLYLGSLPLQHWLNSPLDWGRIQVGNLTRGFTVLTEPL